MYKESLKFLANPYCGAAGNKRFIYLAVSFCYTT